jgi:hypothetical protein
MTTLPEPEIHECFFADGFTPRLAAMALRWPVEEVPAEACHWMLPENVRLLGAPPEQFGLRVVRTAVDAFTVCLLWNELCLRWVEVPRAELLQSTLVPLLDALGTDLNELLAQPISSVPPPVSQAA